MKQAQGFDQEMKLNHIVKNLTHETNTEL